jgi:hypothetical protein
LTNVYIWSTPEFAQDAHNALHKDIKFIWRLIEFDSYVTGPNLFYISSDKFPKKFHNKLVSLTITRHSHVHDHSNKVEYSYDYELKVLDDQSPLNKLKMKA